MACLSGPTRFGVMICWSHRLVTVGFCALLGRSRVFYSMASHLISRFRTITKFVLGCWFGAMVQWGSVRRA